MGCGNDGGAPNFTFGNQHCLFFIGFLLGRLHAVRVFFLILKPKRVRHRLWDIDFNENATVKQPSKSITWRNRHVMTALRTNVQIVRKFAVKQHGAAFIAFGP